MDWIDRFKWQPGLDSLRALAVLHVMAHHTRQGGLVGWWGVDLFFVLSGFLITTVLLKEHYRTQGLDLRRFYRRRVLRLFPAFYAMLIPVSIIGLCLGRQADLETLASSTLASVLYYINYLTALGHPIFPAWGHLWSLGIEEQFYLVWPATLLLLLRLRVKSQGAVMAVVLLVLAGLVAALLGAPETSPARVYNGIEARAFELLSGGVVAMLPAWFDKPRMERLQGYVDALAPPLFMVLLFYGLAPLMASRTGMGLHFLFMSLATGVVVLNIAYGRVRTLSDILSKPALLYCGRLSYSLYLWNWPVATLLNGDLGWRPPWTGDLAISGATLGLTFGLAMISYHGIEVPIARRFLQR